MKNWAKKGRGLGHVTYFWILGPPIISCSDEATDVKFAAGSKLRNTKQKMKNWAKSGRGLGHVTYSLIVGPPIISGSDEATDVEFCSRIEGKEY